MNKGPALLAFGLLAVLAARTIIQIEAKVTSKGPFQRWIKKGRIMAPGFAGPKSQGRVSAPSVVQLKNGRLRMYFWATGQGHQYIYAAEASPKNPYEWKLVTEEPVLGPSPTGNINDKGPSFPWVMRQHDGTWLMYYVAWGSWAPPDELSNRTGLAISNDEGIHWKVLKEPLLPLGTQGEHDAGVTGSVAVLQTGLQTYQMWYTAGERYAILDWISPGFKRGIVHIGHAVSRDGIEWVKTRKADPFSTAGCRQILRSRGIQTSRQSDQRHVSHVAERFHDGKRRGLSPQLRSLQRWPRLEALCRRRDHASHARWL